MKKSPIFDAHSNTLKKIMNHQKDASKDNKQAEQLTVASQRASFEKQLEDARTNLRQATTKINDLQNEVELSRKHVEDNAQEIEVAKEELTKTQEQKIQVQHDLQSATIENINQLSEKISNKQNDIAQGNQSIINLEKTKDQPKKLSSQEQMMMEHLIEQKEQLQQQQVKAQKSVNGANQVVATEKKAVEQAKIEISNVADNDIKDAHLALQNKQIDLNTARYNLRGAKRELANVEESLEEVENKTNLLQGDTHKVLRATKEKLVKDKELLENYQNQLSRLQNANNNMQAVRVELHKAEEKLKQLQKQREDIQQKLAEGINQLTSAKRKELDEQQRIETLQAEIKMLPSKEKVNNTPELVKDAAQVHSTLNNKRMPILKVAALTVSEILTHLDFGSNKNKKR